MFWNLRLEQGVQKVKHIFIVIAKFQKVYKLETLQMFFLW